MIRIPESVDASTGVRDHLPGELHGLAGPVARRGLRHPDQRRRSLDERRVHRERARIDAITERRRA
jgi:hypothetical protein